MQRIKRSGVNANRYFLRQNTWPNRQRPNIPLQPIQPYLSHELEYPRGRIPGSKVLIAQQMYNKFTKH